jgi:hypothetical protein
MHSSLSFLVSGHAQQIFFFGFDSAVGVAIVDPWLCADRDKATADESFCRGSPPISMDSRIDTFSTV